MNRTDLLSNIIIGCAIEVHKELGPGLLESIYHEALCIELMAKNIAFKSEYKIPIFYKGQSIQRHLVMDIFVENLIILELKSVSEILDVHLAQLMTYLKLTQKHLGLLLNFNTTLMKKGIRRIVI